MKATKKSLSIAKKAKRICKKFNVKFIINDNPILQKKLVQMDVT